MNANGQPPEPFDIQNSISKDSAKSITISANFNSPINFASWQNSVPFLESLIVCNHRDEVLENLHLDMQSEPGFLQPKKWVIDRIAAKSTYEILDRGIEIDAGYLNQLNEAERAQVKFQLRKQESTTATETFEIRILARDEWGGLEGMGGLLAAFVMPNDPAIAGILKKAGEVLVSHGHSSALNGYQSGDPARVYMLTAAIWSAIASEKLTYANPPQSFEMVGQKTRRPSTIMKDGLATCLDTTLLFASAIEAVGLNPIAIFQHGHCFVGVWMEEKSFNNLEIKDITEVRKAITARELLIFETTLITGNSPTGFEVAKRTAELALDPSNEHKFLSAIDFKQARMVQIRPLASHDSIGVKTTLVADHPNVLLPLPSLPDFDRVSVEIPEDKPTTPDTRIERWQRKLLDLSLRNRLLNFKSGNQTVPFICPDLSRMEDKLASGSKLRIVSVKDQTSIGGRDANLHYQQTRKELDIEIAGEALERGQLATLLDPDELSKRLTDLYRKAKNDLSEGGSNTLFLAIGFLRWKRNPADQNFYQAPLLLVPVKLLRTSASSPFQLANHEDEVRFNSTLVQLLKKDFDKDISNFESDLPTDENGIDVIQVIEKMRRAVRDIPGFEVLDHTALSRFSFAKYLMWKDLVDRISQLENNRVIRHLIKNPDKAFEPGVTTAFPKCYEIDSKYSPSQLVHPLPADSSQLAAIAAVAEGQDFVLIGPPGTGKSQTIANMIAQCLASGKSVLFVAEKTAALDVVYRRLRERGLGDYCIELHSNKAERRKFLDQMEAAWLASQSSNSDQWFNINERLKVQRDQLNSYVEALHKVDSNGWSAFRAMGVSVSGENDEGIVLDWGDSVRHDQQEYMDLVELINEMSLTFRSLNGSLPPQFLRVTEWTATWETNLIRETALLEQSTYQLHLHFQEFATVIGVPELKDCSLEELEDFRRVALAINSTADNDYRIIFNKSFNELYASLNGLEEDITAYQSVYNQLDSIFDEDGLKIIPVDELDRAWREANAKIWPISFFAKRKVQKLLKSYSRAGYPDPQNDFPKIRNFRLLAERISTSPLAGKTHLWKGVNTDIAKLREHFVLAKETRQSIVELGKRLGKLSEISTTLLPVFSSESANHLVHIKAQDFIESIRRFSLSINNFKNLADASPVKKSASKIFSEIIAATENIRKNRTSLQRWTAWSAIKQRAEKKRLNSFVIALESGCYSPESLSSAFEQAYVRWWLPKAIDRNPSLRSFQRFKHEVVIQDFQKLDDLARCEASSYIHQLLSKNLPSPEQVPKNSELGMLRHQIQLKKPSKTIRRVIEGMPQSFRKLAPCLLMSPLSIAQYLPSNQELFDVVIFDEASQITPWDAIGAISRGRQTVIVGDPKQLPPTNFFGRSEVEDDEAEYFDQDLESILDEAKASGIPSLQLNWHYRSSHESLIAFSNWHYYNNELITFPSSNTKDQAVSLKYIIHGKYDRGKSRTNRQEAEAIVADAVERMKLWLQLPENDRQTLGVITFNSQQQSLVQDLFDEAQRNDPEIEWFFSDERIEPTIVKNLENVQGDERDVMLFSVAFGPDSAGKMSLTFGALNRNGGERRLNVAVTRARRELVVYTSFKADQLNVEKSQSLGVRHLKNFLDYAERGAIALHAEQSGSMGEWESPFEEAVAQRLSAKGWLIVPQIGVSAFRVDLGVVNPDWPGNYLAGIECDGATYHRSATARDRDKIREQVLRNLGWEIIRIWSPDWWYDCEGATQRVHELLLELLEADKNRRQILENVSNNNESVQPIMPTQISSSNFLDVSSPNSQVLNECQEINAKAFYSPEYSEQLRNVILTVIQAESPIREDLLIQRVARLHDFNRTGAKIRDRVLELMTDVPSTIESTGRFLWASSPTPEITTFRQHQNDAESRPVDQIALAELCDLILRFQNDLVELDPAVAIARRLGIARLSSVGKARILEAIEYTTNYISKSQKLVDGFE